MRSTATFNLKLCTQPLPPLRLDARLLIGRDQPPLSMADFNESKTPLTLENVQSWARAEFNDAFRALPRASRVKFIDIEDLSFSRAIQRSLGRSTHKKLLIIGGYAPGEEVEDSRVVAHVHEDSTEISFYRIDEHVAQGKPELQPVRATSNVAFFAPFNKVGDDNGNSQSIHRVSAVILYYFLAADYLKELVRNFNNSRWFPKSFREACAWIENGGERPAPTSRPATARRESTEENFGATRIKREREDCSPQRSRKSKLHVGGVSCSCLLVATKRSAHMRKSSKLSISNSPLPSPITLQPDSTMLKHAYSGLQQECDQYKTKLAAARTRAVNAEALAASRLIDIDLLKGRVERAEKAAAIAKGELHAIKDGLGQDLDQVVKKYGTCTPAI
jgi:hypothetical protein